MVGWMDGCMDGWVDEWVVESVQGLLQQSKTFLGGKSKLCVSTSSRHRGHTLMTSSKFGDFRPPHPLCPTKLPVLLRHSYIGSQKCQLLPPPPYLCDVIYEQPLTAK